MHIFFSQMQLSKAEEKKVEKIWEQCFHQMRALFTKGAVTTVVAAQARLSPRRDGGVCESVLLFALKL